MSIDKILREAKAEEEVRISAISAEYEAIMDILTLAESENIMDRRVAAQQAVSFLAGRAETLRKELEPSPYWSGNFEEGPSL